MKLKISFIEYLNSVPLGWGFLHGPDQGAFDILFDVPSECARHLSTGEADVGLIPVIEYQRIPDLLVLPDIAIASKQEVKSVLFVSKVPLTQVKNIAVDTSSRTSVALLKILLYKFYGLDSIHFQEESPDPDRMLDHYDAALIIGNRALKVVREGLHVYDLAREWNHFTGLPFVFACWAVRANADLGIQRDIFYRSRDLGLEKVDSIARTYSQKLSVPEEEIRTYILENLNYSLDEDNLKGLATFYEAAAELGLISTPKPLEFYPE
ncbi:MAG: menaquinone biosynthesis protein [Acidobacteriota bacterium]